MKLYTEEVLRNSMNSVKYYMEHYDASVIDKIIEKHIKALGCVELPSNEEIEEEAESISKGYKALGLYNEDYYDGFTEGAKWVIEQINQQNNER